VENEKNSKNMNMKKADDDDDDDDDDDNDDGDDDDNIKYLSSQYNDQKIPRLCCYGKGI
jgi:hypothetical protein